MREINFIGNLLLRLPTETEKIIRKIEKSSYKKDKQHRASSYLQPNNINNTNYPNRLRMKPIMAAYELHTNYFRNLKSYLTKST